MTLHINNSEHSEERKNSQPLSFEEQNAIIEAINIVFDLAGVTDKNTLRGTPVVENLQRMLYHYENLQAFWDVQGGWDGVNRLIDKANENQWLDIENNLPPIDMDVLVCDNEKNVYLAQYSGGGEYDWRYYPAIFESVQYTNKDKFKHWRYLPEGI